MMAGVGWVTEADPAFLLNGRESLWSLTVARTEKASAKQEKALPDVPQDCSEVAISDAIKRSSDTAADIAVSAIQFLGDCTASDRALRVSSEGTPNSATLPAEQQEQIRKVLRQALMDVRREVRSTAAQVLATASDEAALSTIEGGVQRGRFSQQEAVSYFGLADIRVAGSYLLRALSQWSPSAKALTVGYLGAAPEYRRMLRNKVFLASAAEPTARAAAATVLSQRDPTFSTYALAVILDPDLPEIVFANAVKGYIAQTEGNGKLDASQRFLIRDAILKREKKLLDSEALKALDEALNLMQF